MDAFKAHLRSIYNEHLRKLQLMYEIDSQRKYDQLDADVQYLGFLITHIK